MALAWKKHGLKALEKCAKEQPASFCKLYALIVPREMKVEHTGGVRALTDEQLDQAIEILQAMMDQRASEDAKVIEGTTGDLALPAPADFEDPQRRRANRLLEHVDTAIGANEHGKRKP